MILISKEVGKNYAMELMCFHKYRSFKDGITFIDLEIDFSYFKGDHNPKFTFALWMLNYTIFEFNFYNVNHIEDDEF